MRDDFRTTGIFNYIAPGTPIKIAVQVAETGEKRIFEAKPAGSYPLRELTPFVEDGNPNTFTWLLPAAAQLPLHPGQSTLNITVLEVGQPLAGEQVTVVAVGPVGLKSVETGHGALGYFFLWPLFAMLLTLYAVILFIYGYLKGLGRPGNHNRRSSLHCFVRGIR